MIEIAKHVRDGGVVGFTLTFKDTDGTPVTPSAVTWSLRDNLGAIVNARENEDLPISAPATSATIVLTGDDILFADGGKRYISITYTYNSTTLGNGVTDRDEIYFIIDDLVGTT